MKRASTMSTITVELIIKMKITSSNAEKTNGFISQMSEIFTISTAQPSELACLPQEPHNEAQDFLLLQDYVCRLTHTLRTLEDTHAYCSKQNSLQALSTSKIAEPYAQPVIA